MLGVVIMNTGTPDAPTPEAIRPYLREFLSDRNLIDVPPIIWRPILEHCILPKRPFKTAPHYQAIWTPEGSPFMLTSIEQRDKLRSRVSELAGEPVAVSLGMRYGNPSTESAIEEMYAAGVSKIIAFPLYPQNTRPCAGTCLQEFDRAFAEVSAAHAGDPVPEVVKVLDYWDAPGYLDVLAQSVREAWDYEPGKRLLVSFHSIPLSYLKYGDTYPETTKATMEGLVERLGVPADAVSVSYQSRFDSRKWLGPFLRPELHRLAAEGVTDVTVVCPIFSVDCIETTFEVGIEAREVFEEAVAAAGGENGKLTYIPALGARDEIIEVLANVVMAHV